MSAPFRITRKPAGGRGAVNGDGNDELKSYLDRLLRLIPAEVIGLYLVGVGFIPEENGPVIAGWTVVCLLGVVAIGPTARAIPMQTKRLNGEQRPYLPSRS